jgi:hypothetical protein
MSSCFDMTLNGLKSSIWLSKSIAPSRRGRHDNHEQRANYTDDTQPLFDGTTSRTGCTDANSNDAPNEKSAASSRHILPSDLPAAIKHLSDQELDQLDAAVTAEQQRRGKKPPPTTTESKRAELPAVTLTIGKQNAVRAAFKAGVTPAKIAKQFGIPQSDVRRVVANEAMKR